MTEQEKKEREDLRFEIACRKEVVKRLEFPLKLVTEAAEKAKQKRVKRIESAREYQSERELQDAYGWEFITEDEYYSILKAMRLGEEYIENTKEPVEAAAHILAEFRLRLLHEIAGFEFELKSDKEKEAIRTRNEEILARRAAREEARKQ